MKFEFSAGGIIYKKDNHALKIALILDSYGRWTFPKGRIEKGEKPEIAAIREVGEEVGIKNLQVVKLLDKIDYWFQSGKELIHKFVYFYLMEAPPAGGAVLKPQEAEIKDARWLAPEKAREILGYKKDSLPLLEKAFKELAIRI